MTNIREFLNFGNLLADNSRKISLKYFKKKINVSSKSNKNKKIYKNQEKVFSTYNKQIKKLKSEIEKNFTYVGNKFPEEARKIHYGEEDEKSIYGEATEKESKELLDEGISLIKLPFDKKDKIKKKN